MNTDEIIDHAIHRGEREGLEALGPVEQFIFAISEAEVHCDIDGIDNLLQDYGTSKMGLFAQAFSAVGASEIANALQAISSSTDPVPEELLSRANHLITVRHQYTYESIRAFVERDT
ncbi:MULTISPECIES: hypothetical protein [unclassified Xanthomonas]|uniref:hypothetical protein n=1 Tax=Xanthomonas sp. LMG 9002 TaxID=1591158 RepID=UPI0013691187|nr:hypothetical protein [Xanthomonas sp. LMG 9002]MXV05658.1 hypothetical protein [Xanthomonas sp. LMG 9002]